MDKKAMFQKRHYEVLAEVIRLTKDEADNRAEMAGMAKMQIKLMDYLQHDNDNFKREEFTNRARRVNAIRHFK